MCTKKYILFMNLFVESNLISGIIWLLCSSQESESFDIKLKSHFDFRLSKLIYMLTLFNLKMMFENKQWECYYYKVTIDCIYSHVDFNALTKPIKYTKWWVTSGQVHGQRRAWLCKLRTVRY